MQSLILLKSARTDILSFLTHGLMTTRVTGPTPSQRRKSKSIARLNTLGYVKFLDFMYVVHFNQRYNLDFD